MKYITSIFRSIYILLSVQPLKAQVDSLALQSDTTCLLLNEKVYQYALVECKPLFDLFVQDDSLGGFQKWVFSNIRIPDIYAEASIQGRVVVEFVINRNGKVCNVKVIRSLDFWMDEEVVRVIKESPLWQPAIHHNKFVSVKLVLPISIKF